MDLDKQPLVTVVTPVYNGEPYLTDCIKSVLAQTYQNWEYVIVNNCSDDNSLEVAQSFAERDSRVRVVNNEKFLPLIQNWNLAARQFSSQSKYLKMVHADDLLFPECLESMTRLAEQNPGVGVVGSYRLVRAHTEPQGLAYPQNVFSGSSPCRIYLLEGIEVFGSPTSVLMRIDLFRDRESLYSERYPIYADAEACFDLLQGSEFGFVHQILTYVRTHDATISRNITPLMQYKLGKLNILKGYGEVYLTKDELKDVVKRDLYQEYYNLWRSLVRPERKLIWSVHLHALKQIGYRIHWGMFLRAFLGLIIGQMISPRKMGASIMRNWTRRRQRRSSSPRTVRSNTGI